MEPPLPPFLLDDEFLPPEPDPPDPPLLPPLLPLPPPEEPRLEPLLVLPELAPPEPPPEDALPPPPARAAPPEAPPPPPPEDVDSSSSSSSSSSLLAELPRLPLAVLPRLAVPPPEAELLLRVPPAEVVPEVLSPLLESEAPLSELFESPDSPPPPDFAVTSNSGLRLVYPSFRGPPVARKRNVCMPVGKSQEISTLPEARPSFPIACSSTTPWP